MVLIIPLFFLLVFVHQAYLQQLTRRESAVRAFLITFGVTAVISEFYSIFDLLTIQTVFLSWCVLTGLLVFLLIWKLNTKNWKLPGIKSIFNLSGLKDLSIFEKLMIFSLLSILIMTFLIALYSPPNNFDSMTYHLARVVHWIQQKSVNFYPTSIPRQNHSMPLVEYLILHLQLLSKSDQYANLVQWAGFVILIMLVSEFTRTFQSSRKGQLLAALFAATIPMAILQSSSTQNDLIVSVFCLSFAYYMSRTMKSPSWHETMFGGLALGLALLTKGTAYILCAGIGLVYGSVSLIRHTKDTKISLVKGYSLMILIALVLNLGFYQRNLDLYAHPLSTETDRLTVDHLSLSGIYSNLIRNSSTHLAVPFPAVNEKFSELVTGHLGDLVDDPDLTFQGAQFKIHFLINDDQAGNPLHLIVISIIILLVLLKRNTSDPYLDTLMGALILSFLLFSILLKWQPWGTRLQLPIFILGAPVFGAYIDRLNQTKYLSFTLCFLLTIYALPFVFLNASRPLIPLFSQESPLRSNRIKRFFSDRPNRYTEYYEIIRPFLRDLGIFHTDRNILYFSTNLGLYEDYLTVIDAINGLNEDYYGLDLGENDWEYPIRILAGQTDAGGYPKFFHVNVGDISHGLTGDSDIYPEYVISTKKSGSDWLSSNHYQIIVDTLSIDLYQKR